MSSKRLLFVAILTALLGGCGAFIKVAYNNSDTALRVMANDYFDIDGAQSELLNSGLQHFHAWHRREELPRYAALFDEAGQRIGRGIQRGDVLWAIESTRTRYRSMIGHAVDDAMPALATVNADNLAALEEKFTEKNEEFRREFLRSGTEERERAQVKAYEKRLRDWIGDLEPAQEKLTLELVRAHPQASQRKLEERKMRQQLLLSILRQAGSRDQMSARLHEYFNDFERNRPPQYADAARRFESDFVDYVVAVDRSLTPVQREKVIQRFSRYAQDFRLLAAENRRKGEGSLAAK